jgi:hypothetical protein
MSSLTGMATGQISDIFKTMIFNGQMKIASASSTRVPNNGSSPMSPAPATVSIPALSGSQIAFVYCEISFQSCLPSTTSNYNKGTMTATATGINMGLSLAIHDATIANVALLQGQSFRNSGFATTTTGSQTVTLAATNSDPTGGAEMTLQTTVFIYTPPF